MTILGYYNMWSYSFTPDLKIFSLQHFDVILDMDWLERHNPMHVHWKFKWLQLEYNG